MKHVLLVDYGGVLGFDHIIKNEEKLAKRLCMTRAELNKRTSEKSPDGRLYRENKLSEVDFWKRVAPKIEISNSLASEFTSMWMDTYSLNTEMMSFLQTLRCEMRVGILTNIDEGRSRLLRSIVDVEKNLDYYFPSYQFGYSKDSPWLWKLLKEELKEYEVVYVDDRAEHVQSALAVGWRGIRYYNLELLKQQIGSTFDRLTT